ncbi:hypothetical protein GPECTOR_13g638 [Gonium pectorale]|uniref:Uncharacterized protein n=1 Tax=Gonium pectorale TaxID=33097 RepID=A0A150GMY3_GONPE|nr:hypothetical protein GPECTOR_13g638 [Gonium pectorale]|eukprot:KXZ51151.1 hypothetical protein GPECTOR_13g638 [Gonium pectorale]
MPGKFRFELANKDLFKQAPYLAAITETRKLHPPQDLYVSYGPNDMGVAMVIKATQRQDWNLVLPTDPQKYDLECGFTYGVTSRRSIWDFLRPVLLAVCRSCPGAFELMWEDGDLGDVVEVGRYDPEVGKSGDIVILHRGLPSAEQFEQASSVGASAQRRGH